MAPSQLLLRGLLHTVVFLSQAKTICDKIIRNITQNKLTINKQIWFSETEDEVAIKIINTQLKVWRNKSAQHLKSLKEWSKKRK